MPPAPTEFGHSAQSIQPNITRVKGECYSSRLVNAIYTRWHCSVPYLWYRLMFNVDQIKQILGVCGGGDYRLSEKHEAFRVTQTEQRGSHLA